ncbi:MULTISPECIES: hypothetical protein [Caballeronia]|uniref:hypothetical protein n=1 Tax=Caballeronia TaxID=1827195 RepID=UPI001FD0A5D1|nr:MULTISPECIES: hypothetical protein [Caballeronia]MDR5799240.1 hypothetical protein [Caballeronia sp. LZ001]
MNQQKDHALTESSEVVELTVEALLTGDRVDLRSCPFLRTRATVEFEYAVVESVVRETPDCVAVAYEDIDVVGYRVGTKLKVSPVKVEVPDIIWEHAFCTGTAKVNGMAIGHISLRGRPDQKGAFEVVLYNSNGEKNSWSGKPLPAATANVTGEQAATARFQRLVKDALVKRTPSDVLNAVAGDKK